MPSYPPEPYLAAMLDALRSIDEKVATEATLKTVAERLLDSASGKSVAQLLADILSKVATEATLQQILNRLPASLSQGGNFKVAIAEDLVGLLKNGGTVNIGNWPTDYAKDNTVASIKGTTSPKTLEDLYNRLGESLPRTVTGTVNVGNFPSSYPLPDSQVTTLKNKMRLAVLDPNTGQYSIVEGYPGSVNTVAQYDENNNPTQKVITMTLVLDDGTTMTLKKTITYTYTGGNLTQVNESAWEVAS